MKDETDGVDPGLRQRHAGATLLEADLVDELRLMVFPTILGRGRRLFPAGIDRLKLQLAEVEDRRFRRRTGPGLPASCVIRFRQYGRSDVTRP